MTDNSFSQPPGPEWRRHTPSGGSIESSGDAWRFSLPALEGTRYANAQIDDYQGLPRRDFRWRPPLKLTVEARFSHNMDQLRGTAGFGFWNDPFAMTGGRLPWLPRTIWYFFGGPPTDLKLARDVPGGGFKAGTLDAIRPAFFALAPAAPLAVPLMNIRALYRALWPIGQRAIGVSEALLGGVDMRAWHRYEIEWGRKHARFTIDSVPVLACSTPPRGPLGFVMWIDNQYMVVAPWGAFRWGLVQIEQTQWMEVRRLDFEPDFGE